MGQITTTQNLVAIKEVRHAGQSYGPECHKGISKKYYGKWNISLAPG